ncbi:hypothetical protein [Neptuniibacter sp. QD37_11]|uniref:hypothetical protein n=1 Tax=Neptuniibacter sp. QD37_11 TaxID=3398209 RepID=UPI0039F4B04E
MNPITPTLICTVPEMVDKYAKPFWETLTSTGTKAALECLWHRDEMESMVDSVAEFRKVRIEGGQYSEFGDLWVMVPEIWRCRRIRHILERALKENPGILSVNVITCGHCMNRGQWEILENLYAGKGITMHLTCEANIEVSAGDISKRTKQNLIMLETDL